MAPSPQQRPPDRGSLDRPPLAQVAEHGWAIAALLAPMQDEDELFASALTLGAVEDHLRAMADALGRTTPVQQQALVQLDWRGRAVLPAALQGGPPTPRREATWYAINGLVPQTLELLDALRRRQPGWFGGAPRAPEP